MCKGLFTITYVRLLLIKVSMPHSQLPDSALSGCLCAYGLTAVTATEKSCTTHEPSLPFIELNLHYYTSILYNVL